MEEEDGQNMKNPMMPIVLISMGVLLVVGFYFLTKKA
jgi:hypothetical protein